MTLGVVIPTRNRPESLARLLSSLERQTRKPEEVIIVDASDDPTITRMVGSRSGIDARILDAAPSVCRQRNVGVRSSTGDAILLCDDDMELDEGYVACLLGFLEEYEEEIAVSGIVAEKDDSGKFQDFPSLTFRRFLWNSIFLLSVWTDLDRIHVPFWGIPLFRLSRLLHRHRGNAPSAAGWPMLVEIRHPFFRTSSYGLGAAMVRREFLLTNPYDESLGRHGVGDHYLMASQICKLRPIIVATSARARHHRAPESRLTDAETYALRVGVLVRHTLSVPGGAMRRRGALLWSLTGNAISFSVLGKWDRVRSTLHAMKDAAFPRNTDSSANDA